LLLLEEEADRLRLAAVMEDIVEEVDRATLFVFEDPDVAVVVVSEGRWKLVVVPPRARGVCSDQSDTSGGADTNPSSSLER